MIALAQMRRLRRIQAELEMLKNDPEVEPNIYVHNILLDIAQVTTKLLKKSRV